MSIVDHVVRSGPSLRLFTPGSEPPPEQPTNRLSADLRVREFWSRYVVPVVGAACNWDPKTIVAYGEGVNYWTELTSDLPIGSIDLFETSEFVKGMRLQPGRAAEFMSTASIRKHCATVQRILQIAGPTQRQAKKDLRRFGAGLIATVPWIEAPDPDDNLPNGDFTHEEILAILAACTQMTRPQGRRIAPGVWWDSLVRFLCATGLRIGTAMAIEWAMIKGDMLVIPGAIAKKKRPQVKYLHPSISETIGRLRGSSPLVFPFPNWPNPGGVRNLQRHREKLMGLAGLPEERQFGFHGFRKYHATELFQSAGLESAAASLNHRDGATTLASYVNHVAQQEAGVKLQRDSINKMRLLQ